MNVLFLTTGVLKNIEDNSIYPSLLREFRNNGHTVYFVTPNEKRTGLGTEYKEENGAHALRVKTGNLTKCGMVEKGISTLRVEGQFKRAIKKYFADVKFDLVLYSTPPITLVKVIRYIKKRDGARSYLLLKDIFPQNAVDLGMMKKTGLKGFIYRSFRKKEKKLYALSDRIGCMSEANCEYVLKHNPEIPREIVEVCPNSVEFRDMRIAAEGREEMRKKYSLPTDKKIFAYGGNLGKPQGIPYLVKCLENADRMSEAHFLIVGDGTEYKRLEAFMAERAPANVTLMKRLPKEDYARLVSACDVGMIFLDRRFTIPNFPSRLLSYMQAGLPTLCATDVNTDVGKVCCEGGFGWWCESADPEDFVRLVNEALSCDLSAMGERAVEYLKDNYTVANAYKTIEKSM